MSDSADAPTDVQFTSRDGVRLAGSLFAPPRPRAALLISSGVGYPRAFYARFAAYGAARGFACLTYDYRGLGDSAPADMRACAADLLDWGCKDAPAALDCLAARCPGVPLFTLGHSFGGQLVGLMDNAHLARGHALVAVGNGFVLLHDPADWWKEFLFFHVLGPLSIARHGYLKGTRYWPGVSMPRRVFWQWRRWCHRPGYYLRDVRDRLQDGHFVMQGAPMRHFAFTDDPVANRRSEGFTRACYRDADYHTCWIAPEDLGAAHIGHSGAFSQRLQAFWPKPFDWFERLMGEG